MRSVVSYQSSVSCFIVADKNRVNSLSLSLYLSHRYMFDFSHKEAEELRSIEKKDVIEWYKTYFRESSPKCRRLAVRVWGCNTDMKETQTEPKSMQVIADAVAFKSTSKFYPSLC